MCDEFIPFEHISNFNAIEEKAKTLFSAPKPPTARIYADKIPCLARNDCRCHSNARMLTQHIVFALRQPTACVGGWSYGASDESYVYDISQIDIPAGLSGTAFDPVYTRHQLPPEYCIGFLDEESQPADTNPVISLEDWLFWNDGTAKSLAYKLCFPGYSVLSATNVVLTVPALRPSKGGRRTCLDDAVVVDPDCRIPRLTMTITYREPIFMRDLWYEAKKSIEKQDEDAYRQKVREALQNDKEKTKT